MLITFLKGFIFVVSLLLIFVVIIQPSQKTGLIGDATDSEKHEKRGFELFLYRTTIVLIFLFISLSILFGALGSGFFAY